MFVGMAMGIRGFFGNRSRMLVGMMMVVMMLVAVVVIVVVTIEVYIKFHSFDSHAGVTHGLKVVTSESQLFQFTIELGEIDAEIQYGTEKHVSADSAEEIEVERLHSWSMNHVSNRRE